MPKDIIKKQPDGAIVSVGRGGGTVKVKGGVLVATGVAELQLTRGDVSACCITEPVHVEGGASVVLAPRWGGRIMDACDCVGVLSLQIASRDGQ